MFRTVLVRGQYKKLPSKNSSNISTYQQSRRDFHNLKSIVSQSQTPVIKEVNVNFNLNQFYFATNSKNKNNQNFSFFDRFKNLIPNDKPSLFGSQNIKMFTETTENTQANSKVSLSKIPSLAGATAKEMQGFKHEILRALQINEKSTDQIQNLLEKIESELEKQTEHQDEFSNTQKELLQKLVGDLCRLTREIVISRGTSKEDMEKLESISKEEMEKLIQKMDEAANSRLTSFAAYATILSLIVAIIIFGYQEQQSKEKEKETRAAVAEKLRIKNEAIQKKVEKIELTYKGLIDKKSALEKTIAKLKNKKQKLKEMLAARWFFTSDLDLALFDIKKDISNKKIELELVSNEINKLEFYVLKKRTIEDTELDYLQEEQEEQNEKKYDYRPPRKGF